MKNYLVTTPKSEMKNSAREAADCLAAGGGRYFRRFGRRPADLGIGSKIFYVEDGYIRGYAEVVLVARGEMLCNTTGRRWPDGYYAVMDATTWKWIVPIPMRGFQGYREFDMDFEVIGGWLDPKPRIGDFSHRELFG